VPDVDVAALVRPGEVVGGRYRVERVLGEGGMGLVFAAVHVDLGHRVAIKLMLPGRQRETEARERFLREARVVVRLRSEHVARVLDFGAETRGPGAAPAPYVVMEYLEGLDLDRLLSEQGPPSIPDAVGYILHACEAIAEAHSLGIVHRDLKPANLFLTRRVDGTPCVKVLDFGISKLTSMARVDGSLTQSNAAFGTPLYMSPEQMRSAKNVDARADIWSLGVILYQLLTGHLPFDGESITELCLRIVETDPLPPRSFRPEIPDEVEQILFQCLQKKPVDRWPSIAALAAALAPFGPPALGEYAERIARIAGHASGSGPSSGPHDELWEAATERMARREPTGPGSITSANWRSPRRGRSGDTTTRILIAAAAVSACAVVVGFAIGRTVTEDAPTGATAEPSTVVDSETMPTSAAAGTPATGAIGATSNPSANLDRSEANAAATASSTAITTATAVRAAPPSTAATSVSAKKEPPRDKPKSNRPTFVDKQR
jgi:eukaryotic-like serine/threonine-protein kinase